MHGYGESIFIASLLICCGNASAQAVDSEPEPAAILEFGGAGSWNLPGGGSSFGANVAVEVTPIENWLEIEAGFTPLFTRHSTELDTDVLFKKPWTLSKKAEVMFGVGPEWVRVRQYGVTMNSLAAEAALDFMFWPTGEHRFGWFLEPAFEYD